MAIRPIFYLCTRILSCMQSNGPKTFDQIIDSFANSVANFNTNYAVFVFLTGLQDFAFIHRDQLQILPYRRTGHSCFICRQAPIERFKIVSCEYVLPLQPQACSFIIIFIRSNSICVLLFQCHFCFVSSLCTHSNCLSILNQKKNQATLIFHRLIILSNKCSDQEITFDDIKKLSDYHIVNQSNVAVLLRMSGGIWPLRAVRQRKVELQPIPGFIAVTTTEPDMISFDDDPNCKRAKMPCGHVIGASLFVVWHSRDLIKKMYS